MKNTAILTEPLARNNPVILQVLGILSLIHI